MMIFNIFIKQLKIDDLLAGKSRRAFYTFHIVPGLQHIDFDDSEIVYASRLIFHPYLRIFQGSFSTIR